MTKFLAVKKHIIALLKAQLAPDLYYHGLHHTLEVYKNAVEIARAHKISRADLTLLKIAVLFHDAGFVKQYNGHEDEGCKMAKAILPKFEFSKEEIKQICGMIVATKIPQMPNTLCEKIIADADLMYLGTDDFIAIGDTLYQEREVYFGHTSPAIWNKIQIEFLTQHKFHTEYCLQNYEPKKAENLKQLKIKK